MAPRRLTIGRVFVKDLKGTARIINDDADVNVKSNHLLKGVPLVNLKNLRAKNRN
jgi:hypothetical protein